MRSIHLRLLPVLLSVVPLICALLPLSAQNKFTIEQVLSPGFPFELVAATKADRIAWIQYERGLRNVYTAAGPGFEPVQLTFHPDDDGNDLSDLRISDDGETLVYVRGHAPNREGWVANPSSDPMGAERAIWTVSTDGGTPHRVVEAGNPVLSPDGKWVLYERGEHLYRAGLQGGNWDDAGPLIRVYGGSEDPVWSPDSRKVAFVSDRDNHSFIGVYDMEDPGITYLAPGVDLDAAPVWSPGGDRIAFIRRPGVAFGGGRGNPFGGARQAGRRAEGESRPGLVESALAGGYTLAIWVADVETGEGREIWHIEPGDSSFAQIRGLIWAGDHLLFMAEPGNWNRVDAGGGNRRAHRRVGGRRIPLLQHQRGRHSPPPHLESPHWRGARRPTHARQWHRDLSGGDRIGRPRGSPECRGGPAPIGRPHSGGGWLATGHCP